MEFEKNVPNKSSKSITYVFFQALICLNGDLIQKDTITHMPPGNAKFLMDSVFGLALRMNQFGLSDAEIGLFCAVVIITAGKSTHENRY